MPSQMLGGHKSAGIMSNHVHQKVTRGRTPTWNRRTFNTSACLGSRDLPSFKHHATHRSAFFIAFLSRMCPSQILPVPSKIRWPLLLSNGPPERGCLVGASLLNHGKRGTSDLQHLNYIPSCIDRYMYLCIYIVQICVLPVSSSYLAHLLVAWLPLCTLHFAPRRGVYEGRGRQGLRRGALVSVGQLLSPELAPLLFLFFCFFGAPLFSTQVKRPICARWQLFHFGLVCS